MSSLFLTKIHNMGQKMTKGARLRLFRENIGVNQTKLSKMLNILPRNWSRYEADQTSPPQEVLLDLAKLGMNVHWYITGEGSMLSELRNKPFNGNFFSAEGLKNKPKSLQSGENGSTMEVTSEGEGPGSTGTGEKDMVAVPERTATQELRELARQEIPVVVGGGEKGLLIPVVGQGLSAGFGFDYDEGEVFRYVKVPSWIARKSRDLVALPIYGDSMEPTISQGEMVVCDSGGFKDNGIYVLRDETRGLMFCKRVAWTPNGWTIMSDNPRYGPLQVEDREIEIVARVIAAIKEVK
jgi:phage repressor protein C with HTH and peptisase S24 domain